MHDIRLYLTNGLHQRAYLCRQLPFLLLQTHYRHAIRRIALDLRPQPEHGAHHMLESIVVHPLDQVGDSVLDAATHPHGFDYVHDPHRHYRSFLPAARAGPGAAPTVKAEIPGSPDNRVAEVFMLGMRREYSRSRTSSPFLQFISVRPSIFELCAHVARRTGSLMAPIASRTLAALQFGITTPQLKSRTKSPISPISGAINGLPAASASNSLLGAAKRKLRMAGSNPQ